MAEEPSLDDDEADEEEELEDDGDDEADEEEELEDDGDEKDPDVDTFLPVKDMHAGAIDLATVNFDFGEGYGEKWEFEDTDICGECGKRVRLTSPGEERHRDVNHNSSCVGYISSDGPMMNYYYPLPYKNYNVKLLQGPLCLVKVDDTWGLALTGGGMDLTWEIAENFMRLNYLPPLQFAERLPRVSGRGESERDRWIIAGCRETLRFVISSARGSLKDLLQLERPAKKKT